MRRLVSARFSSGRPAEFLATGKDRLCGEFIGNQFRSIGPDHEHILDVPMIDMGLHGDHHSLLETSRVAARDHWLLLVPPCADAVPGQHGVVGHPRRGETLHHELINLAGRPARHQLVIGCLVDVADHRVLTVLLRARRAEHGAARLITGIALHIGDVIGSDRIARRKWKSSARLLRRPVWSVALLVRRGVGVGLLPPDLFAGELESGVLKILIEEPNVPTVEYSAAYLPAVDASILPEVAAIAREESWFFGPSRTRRKNFGVRPFLAVRLEHSG
jgi:DNA-binding transcriptional LysR family regulator